jgi:hypothetical protein
MRAGPCRTSSAGGRSAGRTLPHFLCWWKKCGQDLAALPLLVEELEPEEHIHGHVEVASRHRAVPVDALRHLRPAQPRTA